MGLGDKKRLLKIHVPTPQEQRTALKTKGTDYLKSQSRGFGPSTIPQGCLGARTLGVTTDCRDAAAPPFLGTQYRDSEFSREGLSREAKH